MSLSFVLGHCGNTHPVCWRKLCSEAAVAEVPLWGGVLQAEGRGDVGMWGGVLQAEGRARCGDVGRCLQAEGRARCGEQGWLEASVRRSSEGTGRVAWRGLECRAEEDVVPLCVTEKARVLSWVQKTAARSLLCARVVLGNGDAAGTSQM